MAGYITIFIGMIAEGVVIYSVKNNTWSPITGLAIGVVIVAIMAVVWFAHQAIIDAAGRFGLAVVDFFKNNWKKILKWLFVLSAVALTIYMIWVIAVAYDKRSPATPARAPAASATSAPTTTGAEPDHVTARTGVWSPVTRITMDRQVLWDPARNVGFIIRTNSGEEYEYPRDPEGHRLTACERHVYIPEAVSSFQVKLIEGEEPTALRLAWSKYTPGGPCHQTEATTTPEEEEPLEEA